MYLILIKYFYYFYHLKKDKRFKFFVLIDLMFYLMKQYFHLLKMRKAIAKKRKWFMKEVKRKEGYPEKWMRPYILNLTHFNKQYSLMTDQMNRYNEFIIDFMPTQLLPLGNRKKFYNLINKKFKRFFLLLKKKLNKKFVLHYLVLMFRKLKDLFIKSDPMLSKENFTYEFFSTLVFESKYASLLQTYKQQNKNENMNKNKLISFFNLISFFLYRIDFFLFKTISYTSLYRIREMIISGNVIINNHNINTIYYKLNKYDIIEVKNKAISQNKRFYVFSLQFFFNLITSYPQIKRFNDSKKKYYISLYKKIVNMSTNGSYLTQIKNKERVKELDSYVSLMEQIHTYFFNLKNKKLSSLYTFDTLNQYKSNYNIEYEFPFFLKKKNKTLFYYNNPCVLGNITFTIKNGSENTLTTKAVKNGSHLSNYVQLYNYFFKYKQMYYYAYADRIIVSPELVNQLSIEQRKLLYYYSIYFNINLLHII